MSRIAVLRLAVAAMLLILAGAPASADEAVTFTAIALAESGGNTRATLPARKVIQHAGPQRANPSGEDSRGLWQINVSRTSVPNVTRTLTAGRITMPRVSMPQISGRLR